MYRFTVNALWLLLCGIWVTTAKPLSKEFFQEITTCGYEKCRKVDSSTLNVHIVPHSHDDVGWLKTVDQYYYGSKNNIQHAGVQYIISSVVRALQKNPDRRFIQVESAFFYKWWDNQDEATKEIVKELVNNGQLEMTGGAWSMNDEAAAHYHSTIDQFTLGLRLLNDTFGECGRPKIGWQIDPFGHSREMASIFAQLGYDGLFFARLDYRDRNKRKGNLEQDLIWKGSANLDNADLFTSVLYNHYSAPSGFCFDLRCSDSPIITDENEPDYNYELMVNAFANEVSVRAGTYKTHNVLITMGDDFMYEDADVYFINMDRLIKGFEIFNQTFGDTPMNVFYSTPSCYVKAVHDEAISSGLSFPIKSDDFFPYASDPNSYWTGYFTSRSTSKRFERQANNFLQVAKQLSALTAGNADDLRELREAVGIMQHHDAITGTEKQAVSNDYHRIVTKAIDGSVRSSSEKIVDLLKKEETANPNINFNACLLANISFCEESTKEKFVVAIYNPLSRSVSQYVHLPVPSTDFTITDSDDEEVQYQVTQTAYDFKYTGLNTMDYDLVFLAKNIPPLGLKVYKIVNNDPNGANIVLSQTNDDTKFTLGDENAGVELDPATGKLISMTINNFTLFVKNELRYYVSSTGSEIRASGAYVFSPALQDSQPFIDTVSTSTFKGQLFDEIHQVYSSWAKQIIRVYKQESYIEFDWIVGPINKVNDSGSEVISSFSTEIDSGDTFFTDSNGREMLKRTRNFRPTYEYTNEQPTTGNYYPVTAKIAINNEADDVQFAVLNDRAQGGSSLFSGQVELMLHRACTNDDGFGVGESLNETEYGQGKIVRGQHFVTFGSISSKTGKQQSAIERDIAQRKLLAPWIFLAEISDNDVANIESKFTGLTRSLPDNVQILTLEPLSSNSILLRLEHVLEKNEDSNLSVPVSVDLNDLFVYFQINSLRETTLAANQWLEDNERLNWNGQDALTEEMKKLYQKMKAYEISNLEVSLMPMEIRTFVATVSYNTAQN